jgi:hypothetical protein
MGLAAVSPVRSGLDVSIGGGAGCLFCPRTWDGEGGTARSRGFWLEAALEVEGDVKSESAAVEFDTLLLDDSNGGAADVLEAADTYDS